MIHIIRFAGELNVFHYCHSSEEVGGEVGARVPAAFPARSSVLSRPPTLSPLVRGSSDASRWLRPRHTFVPRVSAP